MTNEKVKSWEQLQDQKTKILEKVNKNQSLSLVVAANPFFTLEELVYEIDSSVRQTIEELIRFSHSIAEKRNKIREKQKKTPKKIKEDE